LKNKNIIETKDSKDSVNIMKTPIIEKTKVNKLYEKVEEDRKFPIKGIL